MLHRQDCHTFHKTALYKYGAMSKIEDYAPVLLCPTSVLHIYPGLNPRLCGEKLASGVIAQHVDRFVGSDIGYSF